MGINLDLLVPTAAFLGCAALLIIWLTFGRRKAISFYYCCCGWACIVAEVRSDHSLAQMIGILMLAALLGAGLLTGYGMFKARRAAHKLACSGLPMLARRGRRV